MDISFCYTSKTHRKTHDNSLSTIVIIVKLARFCESVPSELIHASIVTPPLTMTQGKKIVPCSTNIIADI